MKPIIAFTFISMMLVSDHILANATEGAPESQNMEIFENFESTLSEDGPAWLKLAHGFCLSYGIKFPTPSEWIHECSKMKKGISPYITSGVTKAPKLDITYESKTGHPEKIIIHTFQKNLDTVASSKFYKFISVEATCPHHKYYVVIMTASKKDTDCYTQQNSTVNGDITFKRSANC